MFLLSGEGSDDIEMENEPAGILGEISSAPLVSFLMFTQV